MPPKMTEIFSDDDPSKPSIRIQKPLRDMEIIAAIGVIKPDITENDIQAYSEELSGRTKILFDELHTEEKVNVVTFSKVSSAILESLNLFPHNVAGLHSKDVRFLIRVSHVCEKCRLANKTRAYVKNLKIEAHA